MIYGSVCSGIEAPTVAWKSLGWRAAFFSEVAAFPSRVLAHHYPEVPNHGDFTTIRDAARIDLLVGGTPCQSFSIAGLRGGLADERGALALGPDEAANGHLISATIGTRERGDMAERTLIPIPFDTTQVTSAENRSRCAPGDHAPTLSRGAHAPAIAFHQTQDPIAGDDLAPAMSRTSMGIGMGSLVRRLTPRECERLMGFPDDYTAIPGAKDGPRYAALGNSIAVTVLRWIGERIARVEAA